MFITTAQQIKQFCAQIVGNFEVYSLASGAALTTERMSFSKACDECESIAMAQGSGNGIDIRRVKS